MSLCIRLSAVTVSVLHSHSDYSVRCWSSLPDLSPLKFDVLVSASLPCCIPNACGKALLSFKHMWGQRLATVLHKPVSPYFKCASCVHELRLLRGAESAGLAAQFCAPMGRTMLFFFRLLFPWHELGQTIWLTLTSCLNFWENPFPFPRQTLSFSYLHIRKVKENMCMTEKTTGSGPV